MKAGTAGLALAGVGLALGWCRLFADEYLLPQTIVLALGLFIAAWTARRARATSTSLDRPLLAVLAAWTLSAAFSLDPRLSVFGVYGGRTYGLWQAAAFAALFQLTVRAADRDRLVVLALAGAALVSVHAVLQAFGLDPFVPVETLAYGRAMATLASPVYLGAWLALWLPLALDRALTEDGYFGRAALALIAAGLIATVSRGAWLAAALGATLYLGLTGRLRLPRARALAVAAAVAGWCAWALARRGALDFSRPSERLAIWAIALKLFARHPLLGVGPDAFELGLRQVRGEDFLRVLGQGFRLGHAHNDLLQILATTGLIGLAAYAWLLFALCQSAREALILKRSRDAALAAGLFAVFVNLQLNIASLPVYASAAFAAGLLLRPREKAGLPAGVLVAFSAVSLLICLGFSVADRQMKLGRPGSALWIDRCEPAYHLAYVVEQSNKMAAAPGAERRDAADKIAATGEVAAACRPNDAVGHYILGSGSLMQAQLGRSEKLDLAEHELDAALRLDPYRLDLLDWRRQAAAFRGDAALTRALADKIARVRTLR